MSPRAMHVGRMPASVERPGWRERLLLLLVIAIGVARIVSTYRTFSATFDEPVHLESGIEWLQFGRLTVNPMHPPLSRAFIAAGPYIEGVRWQNAPDWKAEGVAELHSRGDYWRTLAYARAGVLPFFILAVLATWSLARQIFGREVALLSAAALTLLPPILAHAGLATTDMAVTAIMPVVVLAGLRWLAEPDLETTTELGAASGLAVLLKFSALVFVPAALAGMLLVKVVVEPREGRRATDPRRPYISGTFGVLFTAFLMLWAGYLFHLGSPESIKLGGLEVGKMVPPGLAKVPFVPAPEFWTGILTVLWYNRISIPAYVLGNVVPGGAWYFFPVALGVKTPLALLALGFVGAVTSIHAAWTHRRWGFAVPLAVAVALLAATMTNNIALGLRHLLPVYPMLAILAAVGAASLWHRRGGTRRWRVAVGLLGAWLAIASVRAHPDYLASFNEIASADPEHYLLASDLDYGQDVGRLADTLRARGIDSVTAYLFSFPDRKLLSSPKRVTEVDWRVATPPATGWVAASALILRTLPGMAWLRGEKPVAKVGTSIYLYHLAPPPGATAPHAR